MVLYARAGSLTPEHSPVRLALIATPAPDGWRVCDEDHQLPPSSYDDIDDAVRDAREYLLHRGGGTLTVTEGPLVISRQEIDPAGGVATS